VKSHDSIRGGMEKNPSRFGKKKKSSQKISYESLAKNVSVSAVSISLRNVFFFSKKNGFLTRVVREGDDTYVPKKEFLPRKRED